ncbi:hypothetical protein Q3G72_034497 [Acer saccharum]|nr:hypothetical protein Q3G72_034497 [Acer saccharum]
MLMVGALAGLTASTISFPLEVARKRLMVGALRGVSNAAFSLQQAASLCHDSTPSPLVAIKPESTDGGVCRTLSL